MKVRAQEFFTSLILGPDESRGNFRRQLFKLLHALNSLG